MPYVVHTIYPVSEIQHAPEILAFGILHRFEAGDVAAALIAV